jgi:putative transposase
LSIARQCRLAGLARSSYYHAPIFESEQNLLLLRRLDELYTEYPFYGSRRMLAVLRRDFAYQINRKRIQRLMSILELAAIYPKPNLSQPAVDHHIYPYLLRSVRIERVNQVWSSDITYIRMQEGFAYLAAVIDWFSRFVLSWATSNTADAWLARDALEGALSGEAKPEIFNTDQGSQFTSRLFVAPLIEHKIAISMDGRGRALDNAFIERLWRTVKYEHIYLHDYATLGELRSGLQTFFHYYNFRRPHQALKYRTPAEVFFDDKQPSGKDLA